MVAFCRERGTGAPWRRSHGRRPHRAARLARGVSAGFRSFHGALLKISGGDTLVTHEGDDSAWIEKDGMAEVRLYLRSAEGTIIIGYDGGDLDGQAGSVRRLRNPMKRLFRLFGIARSHLEE
jgi:hypothetical protein